MLNNPVPKDAMSLHLGTLGPPDMQIRQLRLIRTEEAMLMPVRLPRQELEAGNFEGSHKGGFVRVVWDDEVDVDDVFGRHAGDAGGASVVDGEEASALGAEGGGDAVAEELEGGGPAGVGRHDLDLWLELAEGDALEELEFELVVLEEGFNGGSHCCGVW